MVGIENIAVACEVDLYQLAPEGVGTGIKEGGIDCVGFPQLSSQQNIYQSVTGRAVIVRYT
jgi:hypothetical protein